MKNLEIKNIKSHPSLSLAKANASRDLQINFNQAEDALTHDYKCGFATQSGRSLLPESGADAPTVLSAVYTDSTPAKNRQADVPQYGRSMIEMLGVLAIIGVLSVGGIAGYSKAMHKYRVNKAIEQITLIAGNVRTFFAPQKNYDGVRCNGYACAASGCDGLSSGDGCPIVKKAKIFPDEMITVTDGKIISITNPFGGGVVLDTYSKAKTGDNQAFYIAYNLDKNEEACIELLSNDWTNAGVKAYSVFGGLSYAGKYFKAPLDVAMAVDTCSKAKTAADQGYYISISFYFDIDINSTDWSRYPWQN